MRELQTQVRTSSFQALVRPRIKRTHHLPKHVPTFVGASSIPARSIFFFNRVIL